MWTGKKKKKKKKKGVEIKCKNNPNTKQFDKIIKEEIKQKEEKLNQTKLTNIDDSLMFKYHFSRSTTSKN